MEFPQRVKMSDVARTAGVSVATVSKVVNGRWGVAQATVDRVQQVIDQLGYEASLGAQSLRSHRTNVLGILVAEFEPFSTELLKGASPEVARHRVRAARLLRRGARGATVGWERRSLARLSGTLIDGAIIVTPTVVETKHGFHVVAVDPHTGPSGLPTVDSDNFAGAVLATELPARRSATGASGFIGGRPDLESARLREAGFRKAMADAGVPWTRRSSASAATGSRPPRAPAARAAQPHPTGRPRCSPANDLSAIATMTVARDLGPHGARRPVGHRLRQRARVRAGLPPLTTIMQPLQQMGAEALRLLVDLIAGVERDTHVRLPTELVVRASCRPLR